MAIAKVCFANIDPLFRCFDRTVLALFYNSILKIKLACCISLSFICTCAHHRGNNIQRFLKMKDRTFNNENKGLKDPNTSFFFFFFKLSVY